MVCLTLVLLLGSLFLEEALSANLRACTSNEVFVNGRCVSLKKWGQECQVNEECSRIRATCQSNQCLCKQGVPLVITENREVCDDFKMPTDQLIFHIWKAQEERTKPRTETNLGESDPPNYYNPPYPPSGSPPSTPNKNRGFSAFTDTERFIFFGVFVVILVCGLIACCRCLAICMDSPSRQSGVRARSRSRLRIRVTDESGAGSLDAIRGFLPDYGRNIQTSSNPDTPPPYEEPPEYSLTVSLDNDKNNVKENYGSCSRTVLEKQKNMDTTDKNDQG